MKKKLSLILSLLLVFSLILTACGDSSSQDIAEYVYASELTPEIRAEAETVLMTFMQAFEEDNPALAATLFSEGFDATEENLDAFFSEVHKLVDTPFIPYDAYYMKGLTVSEAPIKVKKDKSAGDYIEITPASDEIYCAMYVSEGEKISRMMTILLARENGEFKITWVAPTDFKYNGEEAPAIYEKTKALSDDGKLLPAYVSSCMLGNVFRPGGFFRYENDLEIEDLCYKLFTEIAESIPLPLELPETTDSAIYEIGIANDDELGVIPMFLYKTSVPVDDEAKLRAESEKVLDALEKLHPGLSENFGYIRFEATNDVLDDNTTSINRETVNIQTR